MSEDLVAQRLGLHEGPTCVTMRCFVIFVVSMHEHIQHMAALTQGPDFSWSNSVSSEEGIGNA